MVVVVEACDKTVVAAPQSGTLQGDGIAGDLSIEGDHPAVDSWSSDLAAKSTDICISAFSPIA